MSRTKKPSKKISKKISKKKTSLIQNIEVFLTSKKDFHKYDSKMNMDIDTVLPRYWELTNRKHFYNWLDKIYSSKYQTANKKHSPVLNKSNKVSFFSIQKLVRDLMQDTSPYRGIFLYHGLGVGKTCAAIAIAEAIQFKREVLILSKASLEDNFKANIYKCGSDYMRQNHHWVFVRGKTSIEKDFLKELGIDEPIIKQNKGAFLIDYTKSPNYNKITRYQKRINNQINYLLDKRFKFIHLDDTRISKKIKMDYFNDKVIIVDEVHNLTNSMANNSPTGKFFYELFMNAKRCKIVFLSGTPIINNVFELAKIYNILRGYISSINYKLIPNFGVELDFNKIKKNLIDNINLDQIVIDKTKKSISISKNPDDFISIETGVKYAPNKANTFGEFKTQMDEKLKAMGETVGFNFKSNIVLNPCLPEDENEFKLKFYNLDQNKLKKTEVIKKRIAGLTSYYEKVDKTLFPELRSINKVIVPMSNYQLTKYQEIRIIELNKEAKQRKQKAGEEKLVSSYRIGSRLHCSFVFPEEIGSPYDKTKVELFKKLENILEERVVGSDYIEDVKSQKEKLASNRKLEKKQRKELNQNYLKALRQESQKYMSLKNGSLEIYSPKYSEIIKKILKSKGCCFIYSQFITLVGLNTLAIALDATNQFCELKIVEREGMYYLDNPEEDKDKMKYIFYSGTIKNKELKEIYRLIYNSEFDSLPPSCKELKEQLKEISGDKQNLHGEIIKIFMTTRTGSEGVDLKHIRQVHIMEPYWQPVLTKQVIGRAVRFESHTRLPPSERFVDVYIYIASITEKQLKTIASGAIKQDIARVNDGLNKKGKAITSDEFLYIISERKLSLINQTQTVIKSSAIDCVLNYYDNKEDNPNLSCLNYDTDERNNSESYLFTPNLEDTMESIDVQQEYDVSIKYGKLQIPPNSGRFFYVVQNPQPGERRFLYDEGVLNKARRPKPVGEVVVEDGKKKVKFFKKKVKKAKKNSGKKKKSSKK